MSSSPVYNAEYAEAALIFDLFLPVYPAKEADLQNVLNDLFDESAIKKNPAFQGATDEELKPALGKIAKAITGYTITRVNGRFRIANGFIDDPVQQVRIIIDLGQVAIPESSEKEEDIKQAAKEYRMAMWAIMELLILRPYAQRVNPETEFWMVETGPAMIHKWVRY